MINETVRLYLQGLLDSGGEHSSCPIVLEHAKAQAVRDGLADEIQPSGSGVVSYRLTEVGRRALSDANDALGARATRMVHKLKTFGPGAKPVVYGWPFEVPLTTPIRRIDGSLVRDDRGLLSRLLFGGGT
jgi:hypothetical protein